MTNLKNLRLLKNFTSFLLILICTLSIAQAQSSHSTEDAKTIDKIYDQMFIDGRCYQWLEYLSLQIGHRLSGSTGAEKAVAWTKSVLDTLHLDSVWLQPCMVPHWVRGAKEEVRLIGNKKGGNIDLPALALGGSVATPGEGLPQAGIVAGVVEVKEWSELEKLGEKGIKGKVVFYNRPMDPTFIRTFNAYGKAVDQRVHGASRAAKYGAAAVLVRSMTLAMDDFPHTGTLIYDPEQPRIPAAAISTLAAEKLSAALQENPKHQLYMKLNCEMLDDKPSFNVIGEIRGSEHPESIIIIGGHLDSWDVGHGAHDDGAGCVQSMDVLRILKAVGYKPKNTIRCVMFMNEENGSRGGKQYAEEATRKNEKHLFALESDAGGFTPRGFTFEADSTVFSGFFEKVRDLEPLFEPYGLTIARGGSGADIGPLRSTKALLSGYSPDSQRYFDYHHTANDTFDKVNKRELEMGAASMAALVYLIDKYGL
ncbi:MAG: M20/M25/M40 family metallo-hydrolase [Lewinellaceae bacterium]|nr:M20/M25/M40 family metallo-hydrolase [Lewinellaceae bacterium]